jgi:membrane-bound lytic murein transglycosylase F
MPNVKLIKVLLFCLFILLFSSCSKPKNALQTVIDRGELVVMTRLDPTTYSIDKFGIESGFEYELASLFAEQLGVGVRFVLPDQFQHILQITQQSIADFAAAGLSITPERKQFLKFTPPYYEVTQQLVYHYRTRRPRSIKYLNNSFFEVLAGSSHAENLRKLKKSHTNLSWIEAYDTNILELITMVNDDLLDYTVADSNQFQIFRSKFPQLNTGFDISKPEKIAWAFPHNDDNSLYDKSVKFMNELRLSGTLKQLQDKYFGYSKHLNYVGICTFKRHVKNRLPALEAFFRESAEKYSLDPILLAAVAYQESHWNRHAVSPTGVRGIMMLTQGTAKQMKVSNRLDPQQSIEGGAHYLDSRIKKIPERISEPDRTWMALASYNIGLGHLEDARILTQKQGANPDKWIDVKQRLPLLAKKKWYKKTKHGYARGNEPVTYVENVRQYTRMLKQSGELTSKPQNNPKTNETLNIQLPAL